MSDKDMLERSVAVKKVCISYLNSCRALEAVKRWRHHQKSSKGNGAKLMLYIQIYLQTTQQETKVKVTHLLQILAVFNYLTLMTSKLLEHFKDSSIIISYIMQGYSFLIYH